MRFAPFLIFAGVALAGCNPAQTGALEAAAVPAAMLTCQGIYAKNAAKLQICLNAVQVGLPIAQALTQTGPAS